MPKHVREGHHTVTAYLTVHDAEDAIAFYEKAFGAKEIRRIEDPENHKIGFAELQIGDSRLMLSDEYPPDVLSPKSIGNTPVAVHLYVDDVDVWAERAIAAGITVIRPVADRMADLRNGIFECPYGHRWFISSAL